MDGMYYALLEGRFLFDFVHEDKLAPEELAKYSALLLPNTALLSDEQCRQLRAYVDARRLAAGHLRDQPVQRAQSSGGADFGLADVFGIHKAGDIVGTTGNAYLARIEKPHEILAGFTDTNWIPGRGKPRARRAGGWPGSDRGARLRGLPAGAVVSRRAADQRAGGGGAAERARAACCTSPAISSAPCGGPAIPTWRGCCRTPSAGSRAANAPVTVEGDGVIETFAWETQAGFAVHILNYTNPAMHRGWIRKFLSHRRRRR